MPINSTIEEQDHLTAIKQQMAAFEEQEHREKIREDNNKILQRTTAHLKHTNPKNQADSHWNTRLNEQDEARYQYWKNHIPEKVRAQEGTYDLRGYYHNYAGTPGVHNPDINRLPETWKKPNHPEFSKYSIYADDKTPGGEYRKMKGKDGKDHTFFMSAEALNYEKSVKWQKEQEKRDRHVQQQGVNPFGGASFAPLAEAIRETDRHIAQMTPEQKKEEVYKLRHDPMSAVGGHTKVNERSWYGAIGAAVPAGVLSTIADVFDLASKFHIEPKNAFGLLEEPQLNKSRYVSEFFRGLSEEVGGKTPKIENKALNVAEQAAVGAAHLTGEVLGLEGIVGAGKMVSGLVTNALKAGIAERGAEMLAKAGEVLPKTEILHGAGKGAKEAAEVFTSMGKSAAAKTISKVGNKVLKHASDPMDWAFVMTGTSKHTNEMYDTVNDLIKNGIPEHATPEEKRYYENLMANKDQITMDGYANLIANSVAFMGLGKAALLQKMMRPMVKEFGSDAASKWISRHMTEQFGPGGMLSKIAEGAVKAGDMTAQTIGEAAHFAAVGAVPSLTEAIVQNSLFDKKIDMKQEMKNIASSFATGAFMAGVPKLITAPLSRDNKPVKGDHFRKEVSPVVEAVYEAANMAGTPDFTRLDLMPGWDHDEAIQGTKEHIRRQFKVQDENALNHITSYLFKAKDNVQEVLEQTHNAKAKRWEETTAQLEESALRGDDVKRILRKAHEAERMIERRFGKQDKFFEEGKFNDIISLFMRGERDKKAVERVHDLLYDVAHLNEAEKTLNQKLGKLDIEHLDKQDINWFMQNAGLITSLSNEAVGKELKSKIGEKPFTNPDQDIDALQQADEQKRQTTGKGLIDEAQMQQMAGVKANEQEAQAETVAAESHEQPNGVDGIIEEVKSILPRDGDILAKMTIDGVERNIAGFVGLEDATQPKSYEDKAQDIRYTIQPSEEGMTLTISDFNGNNEQTFQGLDRQELLQSYANYISGKKADVLADPHIQPPIAVHDSKEAFMERAKGGLLRGTPKMFENASVDYQKTANRTWEKINSLDTPNSDLQGKLEVSKNWKQVVRPESFEATQRAITDAAVIQLLNTREERKKKLEEMRLTHAWDNIVENLPLYINSRIGNLFISDGHADAPMTPEYRSSRSDFLARWLVNGDKDLEVRRIYGDYAKEASRSLKERADFLSLHKHSFEKIEDDFHQAKNGRYTLNIGDHKMEVFRSKLGYDNHTGFDPGLSGPLAAIIVDNAVNDGKMMLSRENQRQYGIKLPNDKEIAARDVISLFLDSSVLESTTPVSAEHVAKGYMHNTENIRELADQFLQITPNQINYFYDGAYRSESIQNMPREDLIPIVENILKHKGVFPSSDMMNQPQEGIQIGNVTFKKGQKLGDAYVENNLLHANLDIKKPFKWATIEVTTKDAPEDVKGLTSGNATSELSYDEVKRINIENTKGGILTESDISIARDEQGDVPIRLWKSSNQNPYLTCNDRLLSVIDNLEPKEFSDIGYSKVRNELMNSIAGTFKNRADFDGMVRELAKTSPLFQKLSDALFGPDGDENLRTAAMSFFTKEKNDYIAIGKDWKTGDTRAILPVQPKAGELFVSDGMGDRRYIVRDLAGIDIQINNNLRDRVYVDSILKDTYFSHNQTLTRLRDNMDESDPVFLHEVLSVDTNSGKSNYGKMSSIDRAVLFANHALDITKPAILRQVTDKDRLFMVSGVERRNMKIDGSEAAFFITNYGRDEYNTVMKENQKRRDILQMLLGEGRYMDNLKQWNVAMSPQEQQEMLAGRSLKGLGLIGGYHYDYEPDFVDGKVSGWRIVMDGNAYKPRLFGAVWDENYYIGQDWDNMSTSTVDALRTGDADVINEERIERFNIQLADLENKYVQELASMGLVTLEPGKEPPMERITSVSTDVTGKPYIGLNTDVEGFQSNVKRIVLHELYNKLELNGLLFGDPALYGSWSNQTKRIGQAFSTGQTFINDFPEGHELYNRKTYKALNAHDLIYKDDNGYRTLSNMRSVAGMDASNLQGVLKSMSTDGQSFMTPTMAREMEIRLGRWSEKKQSIFEMMNKGVDVSKWGHEPLFTVMKSVYWGAENLQGKTGFKIAKTSYKTLIPYEQQGLTPLINWMNANDVGVLHFGSAIKSWGTDRAQIFDGDGNLQGTEFLDNTYVTEHSWDNLKWQLPMDIHPVRERPFSVQMLKTLSDNPDIHPIINKMSDIKQLDSDDDKLANKLAYFGIRQAAPGDNFVNAVESDSNLHAFKGASKLRATIMGLSSTTQTNIQGGAFVRVSAAGRNDLMYQDEHGYTEAVVNPSTLSHIMPAGIDFEMQRMYFKKFKDDMGGVMDILIHRTPLNGLQSSAKANIKDLSTESSGQNIQLPHIMTSILGDDQDGDKLFFALPYYKWVAKGDTKGKWFKDDKAKEAFKKHLETPKIVYDEEDIGLGRMQDQITFDYITEAHRFAARHGSIVYDEKKDEFYQIRQGHNREQKFRAMMDNAMIVKQEGTHQGGLANEFLHKAYEFMDSKEGLVTRTSPIDMQTKHVKELIGKHSVMFSPFGLEQASPTASIKEVDFNLGGQEVISTYALTNSLKHIRDRYFSSPDFNIGKLHWYDGEKAHKFDLPNFIKRGSSIKNRQGRYISDDIGAMLSLAVDAGKDPIMLQGNNNAITANAISSLLLDGYGDSATLMAMNPIVRDYVSEVNAVRFRGDGYQNAFANTFEKYANAIGYLGKSSLTPFFHEVKTHANKLGEQLLDDKWLQRKAEQYKKFVEDGVPMENWTKDYILDQASILSQFYIADQKSKDISKLKVFNNLDKGRMTSFHDYYSAVKQLTGKNDGDPMDLSSMDVLNAAKNASNIENTTPYFVKKALSFVHGSNVLGENMGMEFSKTALTTYGKLISHLPPDVKNNPGQQRVLANAMHSQMWVEALKEVGFTQQDWDDLYLGPQSLSNQWQVIDKAYPDSNLSKFFSVNSVTGDGAVYGTVKVDLREIERNGRQKEFIDSIEKMDKEHIKDQQTREAFTAFMYDYIIHSYITDGNTVAPHLIPDRFINEHPMIQDASQVYVTPTEELEGRVYDNTKRFIASTRNSRVFDFNIINTQDGIQISGIKSNKFTMHDGKVATISIDPGEKVDSILVAKEGPNKSVFAYYKDGEFVRIPTAGVSVDKEVPVYVHTMPDDLTEEYLQNLSDSYSALGQKRTSGGSILFDPSDPIGDGLEYESIAPVDYADPSYDYPDEVDIEQYESLPPEESVQPSPEPVTLTKKRHPDQQEKGKVIFPNDPTPRAAAEHIEAINKQGYGALPERVLINNDLSLRLYREALASHGIDLKRDNEGWVTFSYKRTYDDSAVKVEASDAENLQVNILPKPNIGDSYARFVSQINNDPILKSEYSNIFSKSGIIRNQAEFDDFARADFLEHKELYLIASAINGKQSPKVYLSRVYSDITGTLDGMSAYIKSLKDRLLDNSNNPLVSRLINKANDLPLDDPYWNSLKKSQKTQMIDHLLNC